MNAAEFIARPDWSAAIPPVPPPGSTRHLPTHEDCSSLDVAHVAEFLSVGGVLGNRPGYEERPGQIDMARAIATTFNAREHLMIEAGTGVGKSLAYLVPAILWAWTNDTPVIVSTATRNLQAQLLDADIPHALRILGDDAKSFKVALLKGRMNYLCLKAADEFFAPGYWTLAEDEQELLPGFITWLTKTTDGDLDTYEGLPRVLLARPGDECSGRKCPFFRQCFVQKARRKAAEAHLVVVNHALVLAEATMPGGGILPPYARLVLDEAHNLEDIATDYLSREFSRPALQRILRRLQRHYREAAPQINALTNAADAFLHFLGKMLPLRQEMIRYKAGVTYWKDLSRLKGHQDAFERHLIELVNHLRTVCDTLEDDADLETKLESSANALIAFANDAAFVVKGERNTHAYWVERMRPDRRKSYIRLVAAPLSVAEDLKTMLYDVKDSVVLSSATLRVGSSFAYMTRRLGATERFQCLTAASPFNYLLQTCVLAPDYLPDPSTETEAYTRTFANILPPLFERTHGRALVLFTSYEMMNAVADAAREPLASAGFNLLVQGEGLSRERLTQRLREDPGTILFGAQSFWEGVDVAGEALSCVVIARLPFAQFGEPIVEARGEDIDRHGGSSFRDYLLPEAVIKFRQGFGRLIRTKSDRGVVVVADPRLTRKNYGAIFRKSLPATAHTITSTDELLARVSDFF